MKAAYLKKKNGSATGGTFTAKGTPFSARRREEGKLSGEKVFMEDSPKQGNKLACFFFYYCFISFRRGRQYLEGEEAGGGRERAT